MNISISNLSIFFFSKNVGIYHCWIQFNYFFYPIKKLLIQIKPELLSNSGLLTVSFVPS